jgi:hypothetical protein
MDILSSKGVRITGPTIKFTWHSHLVKPANNEISALLLLYIWFVYRVKQIFPMSILHVAMSSKNCFGPVKGYLLLDQMTSRNLITSSVECECHVNLMVGPVIRTPLLDRMSIQLQFILGSTSVIHFFFVPVPSQDLNFHWHML